MAVIVEAKIIHIHHPTFLQTTRKPFLNVPSANVEKSKLGTSLLGMFRLTTEQIKKNKHGYSFGEVPKLSFWCSYSYLFSYVSLAFDRTQTYTRTHTYSSNTTFRKHLQ